DFAVGRCTRNRPSSVNRLESMKNTTSSNTTSMRETTLISGSSWRRGFRFMGGSCHRHRRGAGRTEVTHLRRFESVGHAHGVLFYPDHDAVYPAAQIAVRD